MLALKGACLACGKPWSGDFCEMCWVSVLEVEPSDHNRWPRISCDKLKTIPLFSLWYYGAAARDAIIRMKHQGPGLMVRLACKLIERYPQAPIQADALVPVPSNLSSLMRRGYRQTSILGQELSRAWKLPVWDILSTPWPFTPNPKRERMFKLNMFSNGKKLKTARIILVDDVITTGASMKAGASVICQNGGITVACLSLAVVMNQ